MFESTVHAVSMVDLVVADWTRELRKYYIIYALLDKTCQGEACKGLQTKNLGSIATVAIL